MNKNYFFLLFVTFISLSGCKKDDPESDKKIVGKWVATKEVWQDYLNGQLTDSGTDTDWDSDDWVLEFKADGKFNEYDDGELEGQGTYSLQDDGKKLVMTYSDDKDEYTIKNLNSSELILFSESTHTSGNQTYIYKEEYTFKKQ